MQARRGGGMTLAVPVTVRGETFPSMSACARAFGISPQAVFDAVERGRTDFIGLGRGWWHKGAAE
jgi:hypothetical protein